MDSRILNYIEQITDEEKKILTTNKIEKSLYTNDKDFTKVDANKVLKRGSLITVRPHTRFIDFPQHKHEYVEAIYVLNGNITNIINDEEININKGDILFLNSEVSHGIKACKKNDLAINFFIKPNFFGESLSMLREDNHIKSFIINELKNHKKCGQFLLFKTDGILPIENTLENLIFSLIRNKNLSESNINKKLMGILFIYLTKYPSSLEKNIKLNNEQKLSKIIENYIDSEYTTATLQEISDRLNITIFQASKLIKTQFRQTFKEMLQNKRFQTAANLLTETNLSIYDIIINIGYENSSYFHRKFKKIFSLSPAEYRRKYKK